jgi:DNA end-binding protein Ku
MVGEGTMRSIWKGSISFGLVSIPIAVYPATTSSEKISFNMLRKGDLSPIKFKRVAEADGKEVPWGDIVKGYQYEKDHYVVFEQTDFDSVELESTHTIAIKDFVEEKEINPIYFQTPYYLEPAKGGDHAYALLRDVLAETRKVGIAKVTLRNREHLAAVRAQDKLLVMELMHFAQEIAPAEAVKAPPAGSSGAREKDMAKTLIEHMSAEWDPQKYQDEYATAVMKLVEQKIKSGGKKVASKATKGAKPATNVVDLVALLQESLAEKGKSTKTTAKKKSGKNRAA